MDVCIVTMVTQESVIFLFANIQKCVKERTFLCGADESGAERHWPLKVSESLESSRHDFWYFSQSIHFHSQLKTFSSLGLANCRRWKTSLWHVALWELIPVFGCTIFNHNDDDDDVTYHMTCGLGNFKHQFKHSTFFVLFPTFLPFLTKKKSRKFLLQISKTTIQICLYMAVCIL